MLKWNSAGDNRFETGVEKGVLYPPGKPGVVWNGLISITENNTGEEVSPSYANGHKYITLTSLAEFEATIEAFTYPDEFEEFDGTAALAAGVRIGQQRRKTFDLSYRTRLGDDIQGDQRGYKLHLIWDAQAAPSEVSYGTINDSPEALTFSWNMVTGTRNIPGGFKPVSHICLDSTKVLPIPLKALEDILYGRNGDARMPSPAEVLSLPWGERPLIILENLESPLPQHAREGDMIFVQANNFVYSLGEPAEARPAIVVPEEDKSLLPEDNLYQQDVVHAESTGNLFVVEETS